jgi:hypothetical protein
MTKPSSFISLTSFKNSNLLPAFQPFHKTSNLPFLRDVFPPDSAPRGKEPVGVKPFNCRTLSLSSLKGNKQLFVSF